MNFKQFMLMTAILAIAIIAGESGSHLPNSNTNVLGIIARSNAAMHENPSRSLGCFQHYGPLLDELIRAYESGYAACETIAQEMVSEAEATILASRKALAAIVDKSCSSLSKCQHLETAEKVFKCYISGGSESVNTMREIKDHASENLLDLQEQLRSIKNMEYLCTNETKREYEKGNSKAVDDLNNCILGVIDVPTSTEVYESSEFSDYFEGTVAPKDDEYFQGTELPSEEAFKQYYDAIRSP